jgi:hypothetical protein
MRAVVSWYAAAGVGLGAAGVVAVTPFLPQPSEVHIATPATRLVTDASPMLDVAENLLSDIAGVPANELNAIQDMSNALFFTGPWLVGSATNLWGVDAADPPKIEALVNMLVPFPALSEPLGQQLAGLLEAEMPTNPACATIFCSGAGDLLGSWFQVPLTGPDSLTSGYTFPTSGPSVTDPAGSVDGVLGFTGTTGTDDLYPWAGTTFTLDLSKPFTDFFNSLTAASSGGPFAAAASAFGTDTPDPFQTLTNFGAALSVMFNPFLPGGPYIPDPSLTSNSGSLTDLTAAFNPLPSGQDFSDPGNLLSGLDLGGLG